MNKLCDLHTHSTYSDGTSTPCEIVREAARLGLCAVALCDHNTVSGLEEFADAAQEYGVVPVCGCEFSVDYRGKELHLIGLFIPREFFSEIEEMMREGAGWKEKSNIQLIKSLGKIGIDLDYEKIKSETPQGSVNRAHIANEMTRLGYVDSVKEAFKLYLSPEAGHYVEPPRISVWEMLEYLLKIGAVPVLAHPLLTMSEDMLREFLVEAVPRGLVGMECLYTTYSEEETRLACEIASEFGLKISGGSDFHGEIKPGVALGLGHGNLRIPAEIYEKLKPAQR